MDNSPIIGIAGHVSQQAMREIVRGRTPCKFGSFNAKKVLADPQTAAYTLKLQMEIARTEEAVRRADAERNYREHQELLKSKPPTASRNGLSRYRARIRELKIRGYELSGELGTAYHEAGHAVASLELKTGLRAACMPPYEEQYSGAVYENARCDAKSEVVVLLAGQVAEEEFTKQKSWGSGNDNAEIDRLLEKLGGNRDAWLSALKRQATTLLKGRWHDVKKLAEQLVLDRCLFTEEIEALLR